MSQPKKLGRPALLVDPEEIRVTLTSDRIAYVRKHWPSLSEGLRALIDAHRVTGKPQGRS